MQFTLKLEKSGTWVVETVIDSVAGCQFAPFFSTPQLHSAMSGIVLCN